MILNPITETEARDILADSPMLWIIDDGSGDTDLAGEAWIELREDEDELRYLVIIGREGQDDYLAGWFCDAVLNNGTLVIIIAQSEERHANLWCSPAGAPSQS